jgi:hypothetical protein
MHPWIMGSVFLAGGLIFFLVGVFGKDFRWGWPSADYLGPPAPRGLAKGVFIIFGLIFVIAGIVVMFQ